jgi:2-methylcitrate dehydratase
VGGHGPADGRTINRESADHNAAFCVAAVLLTGGLGHEEYEALIANPDVMALMAKVELVEDPAATAAFPAALPARMSVELKGGETLEAAQQRPAPMDAAGVATKFEALWPAGRPRAWPWRLAGTTPAFPA